MGDKISERSITFAGFVCWDDACHKKVVRYYGSP
jgi:hypothetical protein